MLIIAEYLKILENLDESKLLRLSELIDDSIHFSDPFNSTKGKDQYIQIMRSVIFDTEDHKFKVLNRSRPESSLKEECLIDENYFFSWEFTFRPTHWLMKHHLITVLGCTELRFNQNGKIVSHIEYWDAAKNFYERLPIIGKILSFLRNKIALKT
jgi:steroid delta-isomerase